MTDPKQFNIVSKPPETPTWDIMQGAERLTIDVDGQHGFVSLVDIMPRLCPVGKFADYAIVQAARVSYGQGTKKVDEDAGLIRYLYRHAHTTPFEMVEVKLHCQMPVFVARQWIRHRTANVNEASARYSEMKDMFWSPVPIDVRAQSNKNKQVSDGQVSPEVAESFVAFVESNAEGSYRQYKEFIDKGVGRELARIALPLNVYTEWYWKIDLHNLFHFLGLRMDQHAQKEIRDYADAIYGLIAPMVPTAAKAFLDYHTAMGGLRLTALELKALARTECRTDYTEALGNPYLEIWVPVIESDNKREREEAYAKFARMGFKYDRDPRDKVRV